MWPFKKKQLKVGTLSNVAHARWLRAGSPHPEIEFLVLGEDEQEALASVGDDYLEDCAAVHAAAMAELIQGIADGLTGQPAAPAASGAVDESEWASRLAARTLAAGARPGPQTPQNRPGAAAQKRPVTMGGVMKRRQERILRDQEDRDAPLRLLGFKPDSLRAREAAETAAQEPPLLDQDAYEKGLGDLDPDTKRDLLEGDWETDDDEPEAGAVIA